jgi:hypothetical protein
MTVFQKQKEPLSSEQRAAILLQVKEGKLTQEEAIRRIRDLDGPEVEWQRWCYRLIFSQETHPAPRKDSSMGKVGSVKAKGVAGIMNIARVWPPVERLA